MLHAGLEMNNQKRRLIARGGRRQPDTNYSYQFDTNYSYQLAFSTPINTITGRVTSYPKKGDEPRKQMYVRREYPGVPTTSRYPVDAIGRVRQGNYGAR